MAKQAQKEEIMELPEGGIADFAMSDEDFAVLEADETKKEFGEEGVAQFTAVAKRMAGHGRFGDDSVAHIQTGEIVVPLSLIENNPNLKEQIFKNLRDNGIEDPEQYVVGSAANSINPETGLMEFGFLSKIFKGIKKAFKAVVKIVKKIAPIVLPIALGMTGLGAIYGAALGSGIGTLLNGGSFKDALKSGIMAGVTGGIMKGFTGPGNFGQNIGAELAAPGARFSQFATNTGNTLKNIGTKLGIPQSGGFEAAQAAGKAPGMFSEFNPVAGTQVDAATSAVTPEAANAAAIEQAKAGVYETPGFGESIMKGDFKTAFRPGSAAPNATEIMAASPGTTAAQAAQMAADAAPGMMRSYLPAVGAATGALALSGGFDVPKQDELDLIARNEDGTYQTGEDLIEADPGKYLLKDLGNVVLNEETGEYETKAMYEPTEMTAYNAQDFELPGLGDDPFLTANGMRTESVSTATGPFARPYVVQNAAQGGQIFPRRNGGIMPDEGVKGKDSVRAMLMPGEFVMTTDAVKGLGGGNMKQGINNMYSVMRNLESRGRQTA